MKIKYRHIAMFGRFQIKEGDFITAAKTIQYEQFPHPGYLSLTKGNKYKVTKISPAEYKGEPFFKVVDDVGKSRKIRFNRNTYFEL